MNNSLKHILAKHHQGVKRRISRHKKASEWLTRQGLNALALREKSAKLLAASALGASLLLSPGTADLQKLAKGAAEQVFAKEVSGENVKRSLISDLAAFLPEIVQPLDKDTETSLSDIFKKYLRIDAVATLEGNHLPTTYGFTGEEQHLTRFPGDSIGEHDELQNIGMAPGLGAWRYFVSSQDALTSESIAMEKYYIAAQTFNIPDWSANQPYLKDWYKYRKVLVVNPKNGQAAVAVIADAGPATWTGKQFGSSPELMHYLGLDVGMKKGEIIVFFVDEKENKIPIGPIDFNNIKMRI